MDLEQRVAALEAEVTRLSGLVSPPRARPLPIADAIARVSCTYLHRCGRHGGRHHKGRCVYVLIDGDVVTYIGRSRTGYSARYPSHEGKPHDRLVIADLTIGSGVNAERAFEALEAALILHFTPRFNIAPLTTLGPAAALWPAANAEVWSRIVAI